MKTQGTGYTGHAGEGGIQAHSMSDLYARYRIVMVAKLHRDGKLSYTAERHGKALAEGTNWDFVASLAASMVIKS